MTEQGGHIVRHPKYMPRDTHIGPRTVRFIPVKDGDVVELGDTAGLSSPNGWTRRTPHIILGFKPGTAAQPRGWLVILVNEDAHPRSKPIKRRESQNRSLRAVG
jgi:hypothetical protein